MIPNPFAVDARPIKSSDLSEKFIIIKEFTDVIINAYAIPYNARRRRKQTRNHAL